MDMPGWHHLQLVEVVLVHKVHLVYKDQLDLRDLAMGLLEHKVRPDLQDRVMDRLVHKDQQVLLVPVMVQLDPLVHKAQLVLLG
jgi:hypothetical protein